MRPLPSLHAADAARIALSGTAFGLVLLLTLATGCSDATVPSLRPPDDAWELPPPDPSLDPARVVVGSYLATPCDLGRPGGFTGLVGRHEWATVDVFFGRPTEAGPWNGPTGEDVQLVRGHGGRVLHEFGVPAVRARMLLSRIPGLVREGFFVEVREVPDVTRYDVPVSVGFDRPLSDADEALFRSLGGVPTHRWEGVRGLAGVLPDRSLDALRGRPDVVWLEYTGVVCTQ